MLIKRPGGIVLGVDQHGADARDIRRLQNAAHGICDQSGSQPFSMPCYIDVEPGENADGDGVARDAFLEPVRGVVMDNIAHNQRVVAYDGFAGCRDVGLRYSRALALQRMYFDEAIEGLVATVEAAGIVGGRDLGNSRLPGMRLIEERRFV
jgi:hypothetical protein